MGGTRRVDFSSVWRTGRLDRFSSRCPLTLLPAIRWAHLVDEAPIKRAEHRSSGDRFIERRGEPRGGRGGRAGVGWEGGREGGSNKGSAAASVTIRMNGESYRGHSSSLTTETCIVLAFVFVRARAQTRTTAESVLHLAHRCSTVAAPLSRLL